MVTTAKEFYRVVEVILLPNGNIGEQTPWNFENKPDAEARFYGILAEACKSEVPYHAAFILSSDGRTLEGRKFDRRYNDQDDNWYWDEDQQSWVKGATPVPEPDVEPEAEVAE